MNKFYQTQESLELKMQIEDNLNRRRKKNQRRRLDSRDEGVVTSLNTQTTSEGHFSPESF